MSSPTRFPPDMQLSGPSLRVTITSILALKDYCCVSTTTELGKFTNTNTCTLGENLDGTDVCRTMSYHQGSVGVVDNRCEH